MALCGYIEQRLQSLFQKYDPKILQKYIKEVNKLLDMNLYYDGDANHTERHHIVPRCLDHSLIKDTNNIVVVDTNSHLRLHRILAETQIKCLVDARDLAIVARKDFVSESEYDESKLNIGRRNSRVVINLTTGKRYASAASAAREYNVSPSVVVKSCNKHGFAGGCLWYWVDQINDRTIDQLISECHDIITRRKAIGWNCRAVVNLNTSDHFQNARLATQWCIEHTGKKSTVLQACKKHIKAGDCYWAFEEDVGNKSYQEIIEQYKYESDLKNGIAKSCKLNGCTNGNVRFVFNINTLEVVVGLTQLYKRSYPGKNTKNKSSLIGRKINSFCPINGEYWFWWDPKLTTEDNIKAFNEAKTKHRSHLSRKSIYDRSY